MARVLHCITTLQKELEEAKEKVKDLHRILADEYPASNLTDEKSTTSSKRKKTRLSKKSAGEILRLGRCLWKVHLCTHDPANQPSEAQDIISEIVTSVAEKKRSEVRTLNPCP